MVEKLEVTKQALMVLLQNMTSTEEKLAHSKKIHQAELPNTIDTEEKSEVINSYYSSSSSEYS